MSQSSPVLGKTIAEIEAGPHIHAPGRLAELDGLRGIAILAVLVFHFTPNSGPLVFLWHGFQAGWMGVDLFFVLSGYLITGILLDTAGRPHAYRNFIVRRTLRIFPLYYACIPLYAMLTFYPVAIRWNDFLHVGGALWYLAYLGNMKAFLQNSWPGAAILTPLWSLQVEEQFYLTFPFLVFSLARKTLAKVLLGSVIAALLLRIVLVLSLPQNKFGTYLLMPCRMDALAMGGLVAIACREWPEWLKNRWIGRLTGLCAAIFLLICVLWKENPWSDAMRTLGYTAVDLAFTGILVMLITGRYRGLVALCRLRPVVWLGTISYGLYLLHVPALNIADRWLVPGLGLAPRGSVEMLVSLVLAVCLAGLSWFLFESRVLRLKERFTMR